MSAMSTLMRIKEKITDIIMFPIALWAMYDAEDRELKTQFDQYGEAADKQ